MCQKNNFFYSKRAFLYMVYAGVRVEPVTTPIRNGRDAYMPIIASTTRVDTFWLRWRQRSGRPAFLEKMSTFSARARSGHMGYLHKALDESFAGIPFPGTGGKF